MNKVAVILVAAGLALMEGLLFFSETLKDAALPLSLVPVLLGGAGLFFILRARAPARPETPSTEELDTGTALRASAAAAVPDSKDALSVPETEMPPAMRQEIEIYKKALPALFQSIVDYLNKTTEPMSESLVSIKTGMKDFITGVKERDSEIVDARSLDLMTGNVDRLQESINLVAQKSIDSFGVFGKEFTSLKDVLASVFKLTGDISEIAERVHVLSINASIESARAGVHGRGFKVIANEIQKLAHETQAFLKDIKVVAGSSEEIFTFVDRELENSKTNLFTMVQSEKETFDKLNETITSHYGQFKNLYSGIIQFVGGLEGNMNSLFPISMLHAIIIQEVENLDKVSADLLVTLAEGGDGTLAADGKFDQLSSIERLRKRLTTSRELDALEKVIRDLGLADKINLQRSTNDYEFF